MATNTLERPTTIISAAVTADLAARLGKLARANDRSLSAEIRRAIVAHLLREED